MAGCDPVTSGSRHERLSGWFNTACFAAPGPYDMGNAPRIWDDVRADGVNNVDLSIGKAFTITGETKLDFRVEAFNLFNRTQFSWPTSSVGARSFGAVTAQRNLQRLIQLGLRLTF